MDKGENKTELEPNPCITESKEYEKGKEPFVEEKLSALVEEGKKHGSLSSN